MLPAAFIPFFAASVGTSGGLIGLLFIAVSIDPARTVGKSATPEREALAANAFTALSNVFFISFVALVPLPTLGDALILVGVASCIATIRLATHLLGGGRQGQEPLKLLQKARRLALVATSLVIYGLEIWQGAQLVVSVQHNVGAMSGAAFLLIATYGLALARMWVLLGARKDSILSWLSITRDMDEQV